MRFRSPFGSTRLLFFQHSFSVAFRNTFEIFYETIRILRHNPIPFLTTLFFLVCPQSVALLLSNSRLTPDLTVILSGRFMILSFNSGIPLTHLVRQLCAFLAGTILSSVSCFPLLLTLLPMAKSSIVYTVACVYSANKTTAGGYLSVLRAVWRRMVVTYLCSCLLIAACLGISVLLLLSICITLIAINYPQEFILYPAILVVLSFFTAYAHIMVVNNLATVVSVLEEKSGFDALNRSVELTRGKTQASLRLFIGSTFGLAFVQGFLEYKVKSFAYQDGVSRRFNFFLLVFLYSFVVLVDSIVSAVFYFTCRSSSSEL